MPILMLFLPAHVLCAALAILLSAMPWVVATTLLVLVLVPYYSITLRGLPHTCGCRTWPEYGALMSRLLPKALATWFGQEVQVHVHPPLHGSKPS